MSEAALVVAVKAAELEAAAAEEAELASDDESDSSDNGEGDDAGACSKCHWGLLLGLCCYLSLNTSSVALSSVAQ